MIGIYLITNKLNGKKYVGQSNDIERRFKEHCYPGRYKNGYPIDVAIHVDGKENFDFSVLEECSIEELNQKETYWIEKLQTYKKGYNCNLGGDQFSIGEQNSNASLTEDEVKQIRQDYANHLTQTEAYQKVSDKVTFTTFQAIWQGKTWTHIMPEVFTPENKAYYRKGGTSTDIFSEEDVVNYRTLYMTKTADEIYDIDPVAATKVTIQSFKKMLSGLTYIDYPFYSKTNKKWFFNGERPESKKRGKKVDMSKRDTTFTDEQVTQYRQLYVDHTAKEVYDMSGATIAFDSFRKMLEGKHYSYLPYYSKKNKCWINPEAVSTISESGE